MNENIIKLAHRLLDLDPYEARDNGETVETISALIVNSPEYIIEKLLDTIEELQM